MSRSDDIRRKLADIAAKRTAVEKQHSDASARQASKNAEHARYSEQVRRTSSEATRRSYLGQADRAACAALAEGKRMADLSKKRADLAKDEGVQHKALAEAVKREAADQETKAKKARQDEDRRRADERRADRRLQQARQEDRNRTEALVGWTEQRLSDRIDAAVRPPRPEQLRILYATANPHGDLRVEEEIRRAKAVVKMSTYRDQVLIEHLPAATAGDLLDGLPELRPHVVHFSGHSNESVLSFDDGSDTRGAGKTVTAKAFKSAMEAPDEPPVLVVLNSCKSAAQLRALLGKVAVAGGMSDAIGDPDALTFATRFYRSLAEGQSVQAARNTARADMEANGLPDHDLPTLEVVDGVAPALVRLVQVPG